MEFILIPVDFSDCSKKAIEYAINIAEKFRWNIELLHVLEPDISANPHQIYPIYEAPRQGAAQQHLKMIQEALIKELGDDNQIEINYRIETGLAKDVIENLSEQTECSLIVLGTHGASRSSRFFGSLAVNMIQKVETTLLLVPETIMNTDINNILFATNFNYKDQILVGELEALAKVFNANIHCMHISSGEDIQNEISSMEDLKKQFDGEKSDIEVTFEVKEFTEDNKTKELFSYVEEMNADLIAMHTMPRSNFLQKLVQPSLTKKVAERSTVPMIIFSN